MSQPIKTLLGDLQRVVQQLDDQDNKENGPVKRAPLAQEPDTARASKLNNADENEMKVAGDNEREVAGVDIGADFGNTIKLERVEVTPEGRVRMIVSVKKEELQT